MPRSSLLISRVLTLIALSAVSVSRLRAQNTTPASENTGLTASATRRVGDVRIDGRLDEPAWKLAIPITRFRQTQPNEGDAATQRTEVRILFDGEAVYIGARMYDSLGARGVHGRLARRDELVPGNGMSMSMSALTSDLFVVHFDTFHDHLGEAIFLINPLGVRGDALNIGGSGPDPAWDPVWEGAARTDSLGWTAEIRIPLSQLRFSRSRAQTWGMQVERFVDRRNEWDEWAFWRRTESGGPIKYGSLAGLEIDRHTRSLEILPYVVTGDRFAAATPGDPFHSTSDAIYRAGADVRYLLTSNLTLDATINPDFGQVEADPAVVNLSAFESFFPEKRPFFVAGAGAFDFGNSGCFFCSNFSSLTVFYSRRIGRPPQLGEYVGENSKFADVPDASTILGAAKLTGRTYNGYTVGMLDAVTAREVAAYRTGVSPPTLFQAVEPLTNYFVGRGRRDFNAGNTVIGGILTSTVRRLHDELLTDSLHAHAEAAGADVSQSWANQRYSFRSQLVLSDVGGSAAAITRTMRSSAHYFQRPDRKDTGAGLFSARYDTTATDLRGYGYYARLAKDNGNWLWEVQNNVRSPGFEVNDLAFLNRADYDWMNANLLRQWTVPGSWYRNVNVIVGGQQQFNYDGLLTDRQVQSFSSVQFLNYWSVFGFFIHHPVVYDDRATRGGPVVRGHGFNDVGYNLSSDNRARVVVGLNGEWGRGIRETSNFSFVRPGITVKFGSNASVDFTPSYSQSRGPQYVSTIGDPTATSFFGSRYVFSQIDQRSLSLDTRLNVTFTPQLTLELYAQPFFASGRFYDYEEYVAPRAIGKLVYGRDIGTIGELRDSTGALTGFRIDPDAAGPAAPFTIDNPNFSLRSLRGNAVVRWEYRPGSTLFFVWQQSRSGSTDVGTFDLQRDRALLFRDRPINIFELKVNYWLGR